MPKISLTYSNETDDWLVENTSKKRGAKQEYIRSLLNMVRNGVLILNSNEGLVLHTTTKTDDWLPLEQLQRRKKVSTAVPIYPIEHMADLMSEIKAAISGRKETKDTLSDMSEEQQKIMKALEE